MKRPKEKKSCFSHIICGVHVICHLSFAFFQLLEEQVLQDLWPSQQYCAALLLLWAIRILSFNDVSMYKTDLDKIINSYSFSMCWNDTTNIGIWALTIQLYHIRPLKTNIIWKIKDCLCFLFFNHFLSTCETFDTENNSNGTLHQQ